MSCEHDADSNGVLVARAANIVRIDMLNVEVSSNGSKCQDLSVPTSLLALVTMTLNGPNPPRAIK